MSEISISAYTRSGYDRQRLHVKVYPEPTGDRRMEIRSGDVCLYMGVEDARALATEMLAALAVG